MPATAPSPGLMTASAPQRWSNISRTLFRALASAVLVNDHHLFLQPSHAVARNAKVASNKYSHRAAASAAQSETAFDASAALLQLHQGDPPNPEHLDTYAGGVYYRNGDKKADGIYVTVKGGSNPPDSTPAEEIDESVFKAVLDADRKKGQNPHIENALFVWLPKGGGGAGWYQHDTIYHVKLGPSGLTGVTGDMQRNEDGTAKKEQGRTPATIQLDRNRRRIMSLGTNAANPSEQWIMEPPAAEPQGSDIERAGRARDQKEEPAKPKPEKEADSNTGLIVAVVLLLLLMGVVAAFSPGVMGGAEARDRADGQASSATGVTVNKGQMTAEGEAGEGEKATKGDEKEE